MGNFKEDIARVRAIVLDVDGVLTDGGIYITPDGDFIRKYNSKDGYALAVAIKKGYHVAIITGGRGEGLKRRFDMLGVKHLYLNCMEKRKALEELCATLHLAAEEVLYMGDDLPDLEPMQKSGMPVCPSDAAPEILEASRYVSQFKGGEGCVRDVVEQVLRARGDWFGTQPQDFMNVPSR